MPVPERIDQIARDVEMHAKSLTEIVLDQREMKDELTHFRDNARAELTAIDKREAVRLERDKNLDGRLDRIEASIHAVYGLGKWLLAAVGSTLLVALVGFVIKGGLFGS